ncbi:hypothetical protein IQ268_03075 [Oculatella sp. LEGE 06141]|uniref:hypothetical protein n=1 Tax=Oculatella sp. LEGE 06141 TaxID=1828648 RepID=UPI00187FD4AA|nr:hypothetical protein [Oculatella sp. LEGE 06141]MBE9177559.1 hypothetical protein [Oculatella sp. LEGE 06141]
MLKTLFQAVSITFSLYVLMGVSSVPTAQTVFLTDIQASVPQLEALYRLAKLTHANKE